MKTHSLTEWLDEVCSHCQDPDCGWSDFPHHAPNNVCPECGGSVTPPADGELIEIDATLIEENR